MRDTDQCLSDDEPDRPIPWIERIGASVWVRLL
jgi:hypothetical protein